jgi:signal transduction histidine kinase
MKGEAETMGDQSGAAEGMLPAINRMIEAMAEAVLVIDPSGMVVAANQAVVDLFGLPTQPSAFRSIDQYGKLITSWRLGEEAFLPDELRRSLEGKSLPRQVATITTADRTEHIIEFTVTPIRDEQAHVMLGMMVASDITAQHRLRAHWQAVASSAQVLSSDLSLEELLNTVLDEIFQALGGQVVIGVWAVDETGKRLDILAYRGLSEVTARRVQSLPLDDPSLICTAARTRQVLSTENARETPPAFDLDRRLVEDEGLVSWIAAPLLSAGRLLGAVSYGSRSPRHFYEEDLHTIAAVAGLFGTALDHAFLRQEMQEINQRLLISGVREQEMAEEAALKAAQMNALVENQTEGVTIADSTGHIVMMNRAAQKTSGCSEEDWPRTLQDYRRMDLRRLDGSSLPFEDWPLSRALRGERFEDQEVLLVSSGGAKRRMLYSGSAVREDDAKVALAITVHRDVTELRELEQVKGEYISTISHDLRNPITSVMGYAQMLERQLTRRNLVKEARNAALILTSAKRMNAMIQDLVESSSLESGKMELSKKPADLNVLVSDVADRIGSPEDRARLQVETTQWITPLPLDPARFERAVVNLLTNALRYSPSDSTVLVRVGCTDEQAVVSVVDRGDGIAPDELPHLFDRFYRAKNARRTDGLGLGLYITRLIVEAHGGRVWAESELGKGSAFHISLPLEA